MASEAAGVFLVERVSTPWRAHVRFPAELTPQGLFAQPGRIGLEVVLAMATRKPTASTLREAWKVRRGSRPAPVLLVVFYPSADGELVATCGPVGEQPVVFSDIQVSQAEALARVALDEPSHHAATRFLLGALAELDSQLPGLRNVGLLATQELSAGVPKRADWQAATQRSTPLLRLRGRRLVEGLGWRVEPLATNTSVLIAGREQRAIAVFCDDNEPFDVASDRFPLSPASQALSAASENGIDWVILTRSQEVRLYAARPNTGVGRRGRAETFIEANLALLPQESAGYLHLLFSSDALQSGGLIEGVLEGSERFAADLAVRLRERVYHEAVPALAQAVSDRLPKGEELTEEALSRAYEKVLVILFRLLFLAYAEDKDLLPMRSNDHYREQSLTELAKRRATDRHTGKLPEPESHEMWLRVDRLWRTVSDGNPAWGVPAYSGGLFSQDPDVSEIGAELAGVTLNDDEFAPALDAIMLAEGAEGEGLVDFRSLSVREFGTIYEGLLESRLSVAQDDLALKRIKGQDRYVPAADSDEVVVVAGKVYFRNRSGVRKSTGSYFTKPFAVEHLLDHALEPALDAHVSRLDSLHALGDEAAVARAFFDFRCADIAMGSAHFLVAAMDRIEARLSGWLATHPVPTITQELQRVQAAAHKAMGVSGEGIEIEAGTLLRRQVARHCIYGVDRNRIAVELARLAIWVHTFVPGLPLSFLDHNLVHGDSLTGVGTLDDVVTVLDPDADPRVTSLFRDRLLDLLSAAEQPLQRLAQTWDASRREIEMAREAKLEAEKAVTDSGVRAIFDVVTAYRADSCELPGSHTPDEFKRIADQPSVPQVIERLMPLHFPAAFPEVFLRDNPGFDCLVGNPPWEKVVVDREVWWGMHLPGVRSLPVARRRARIDALEATRPDLGNQFALEHERAEALKLLLRATFPNLGAGQTDLYKAFAWANWSLCRPGGMIGIVLPRTAVADAGMMNWRREVVGGGAFPSPSQWRRSSTTRGGCSRTYTTPTRWRWRPSAAHHRRDLHQYQAVGLRRGGRTLHVHPGRPRTAEPANQAGEVALTTRQNRALQCTPVRRGRCSTSESWLTASRN